MSFYKVFIFSLIFYQIHVLYPSKSHVVALLLCVLYGKAVISLAFATPHNHHQGKTIQKDTKNITTPSAIFNSFPYLTSTHYANELQIVIAVAMHSLLSAGR